MTAPYLREPRLPIDFDASEDRFGADVDHARDAALTDALEAVWARVERSIERMEASDAA